MLTRPLGLAWRPVPAPEGLRLVSVLDRATSDAYGWTFLRCMTPSEQLAYVASGVLPDPFARASAV